MLTASSCCLWFNWCGTWTSEQRERAVGRVPAASSTQVTHDASGDLLSVSKRLIHKNLEQEKPVLSKSSLDPVAMLPYHPLEQIKRGKKVQRRKKRNFENRVNTREKKENKNHKKRVKDCPLIHLPPMIISEPSPLPLTGRDLRRVKTTFIPVANVPQKQPSPDRKRLVSNREKQQT
ncbi:hypothetical protein KCV07_g352, partial [Aureobasidium melanogenum]